MEISMLIAFTFYEKVNLRLNSILTIYCLILLKFAFASINAQSIDESLDFGRVLFLIEKRSLVDRPAYSISICKSIDWYLIEIEIHLDFFMGLPNKIAEDWVRADTNRDLLYRLIG